MSVQELVEVVASVRKGNHESIRMGEPFRFTEACNASWDGGDAVWQGDMSIKLVDRTVPDGYKPATKDQLTKMIQSGLGLVPGNDSTEGSRHCLNSLDGVKVYLPSTYEDEGNLLGPILHLTNGCEIKHPTHGNVIVPDCFDAVAIGYQREYDLEQKMERRARD
jgi:hypothetical protein